MHFVMQTLLTLDITNNAITGKGIEHLADALRNNTVDIFFLVIYLIF